LSVIVDAAQPWHVPPSRSNKGTVLVVEVDDLDVALVRRDIGPETVQRGLDTV
jgi:hypothetical protein